MRHYQRTRNQGKSNHNHKESTPFSSSHIQSIPPDTQSQQKENESQNNPNINNPDSKKWVRADVISLFALIVSAGLAVVTYWLYTIAAGQADSVVKAGNAAEKSAKVAQQTLEETKKYNSASLALQKKSFDSSNESGKSLFKETKDYNDQTLENQRESYEANLKDSKLRFTRDTSAINLQIKSLKQGQEQFIKQNEPYLKIVIDTVYVKFNQLCFGYTISNLSNTPVRVIGEKSGIEVLEFSPIASIPIANAFDGVFYVIKEVSQSKVMTIHNLTEDQVKWGNNGVSSIYWNAEFNYVNQITEEKRIYRISVKINKTRGDNPPYQSFSDNYNGPEPPTIGVK